MKRFADYAPAHSVHLIGILIFLGSLALYIRTTAPTLGGAFDSEEFQFAAPSLAIAHATGYPLYLLLGKFFTTLVPIGNVAYRMNLLSAPIGALTIVLVYLNALILTRRHIASIAAAALFATNPAVWRQAGVASVGPLHLLLVAAIVYAMFLWHEKRGLKKPGFSNGDNCLTIAAFLFGLGLAHHRTTLWLAIPISLVVVLVDPGILHRPRDIAKNLFWLALPLLFYLYLPIFGNNSPWYSNTLQGFFAQITGGDAGAYLRATPDQILEGIISTSQYLLDSFGYIGLMLIIVGALYRIRKPEARFQNLFLGLATFIFSVWGTLYAGEPDRYLVMPFMFLIYWFAIGVSAVGNGMASRYTAKPRTFPPSKLGIALQSAAPLAGTSLAMTLTQIALGIVLILLITLPFADHFRIADWSTFDRTYKLWDEVFTLPIPRNATMVGNWGQINAMRYLQRIEHRRTDLQIVGTLYDVTPQTEAAQATLADGRAIFLAPSVAPPSGDYRFALLGPLLQVRDKPERQAPTNAKNIVVSPSLTLADYQITTALEPYAPTTSIAPARTARVSLTWHAEEVIKDFLVRLKLFDPDGRLISQKDEAAVRGMYLSSRWQAGEYVNDVHNFLIPAGSPPGRYQLKLQTLDSETKKTTSAEIILVSLIIEHATNLTSEQVFIQHSTDVALSDRIALLGYGGLDNPRGAGETIDISLVFAAQENVEQDANIGIALVDSSGKAQANWQRAPISFYPTREWRKGEILKAYYDLSLPENLSAGEYAMVVSLGQISTTIGKLRIVP